MAVRIIIPARLESERLPNKVIFPINERPLLVYTYEQCRKSKADSVHIAVEFDPKQNINKILKGWVSPSKLINTPKDCLNGSHRVFEAVKSLSDFSINDIIINVQADYPTIDPELINKIIDNLKIARFRYCCTTAAYYATDNPCDNNYELNNRNNVKVITRYPANYANKVPECLYFSRENINNLIHIGIYGFSNYYILERFITKTKEHKYDDFVDDKTLEQLYWLLYTNTPIYCVIFNKPVLAINTIEDYKGLVLSMK